jgi:hypothetical protein
MPFLGARSTFVKKYTDDHIRDFVGTKSQIAAREDELNNVADKYWKEQNDLRTDKSNQLFMEFKRDLFEENGVTRHPEAEKAFQIAQSLNDEGHRGVADIFETIVELIK